AGGSSISRPTRSAGSRAVGSRAGGRGAGARAARAGGGRPLPATLACAAGEVAPTTRHRRARDRELVLDDLLAQRDVAIAVEVALHRVAELACGGEPVGAIARGVAD